MESNILPEVTNWKLREVIQYVEVINKDSVKYQEEILLKLNIPTSKEYVGIIRGETHIDWNLLSNHYKFYFDRAGWEKRIEEAFRISELKNSQHLIITYGWEEPTVMIPTELFFDDWEDFIASTHYESLIFSEDYKLIMEISRDYYLHSNFEILKE